MAYQEAWQGAPDHLKQDLLDQIAAARKAAGLTQAQLADQVGTQQSNIARLESGKGNPSLATLLAVLDGLNRRIRLELQEPVVK